MTRSSLLLIGGVLVVSAVSLSAVRSPEADPPAAVSRFHLDETGPKGVFIPNLGQAPTGAFFYLKREQATVLLKATTIVFDLPGDDNEQSPSSLYFISASKSPRVVGLESVPGMTGFRAVKYRGLYGGVDLTLATDTDRLSGRFTLSTGADPNLILFRTLGDDESRVGAPDAYQVKDGVRIPVIARFERARYGSIQLELGQYDVNVPVEVDFAIRL